MQTAERQPTTVTLEPVWYIYIELPDHDVARVRKAVVETARLEYGCYDNVCFEGTLGTQYFRPLSGSTVVSMLK